MTYDGAMKVLQFSIVSIVMHNFSLASSILCFEMINNLIQLNNYKKMIELNIENSNYVLKTMLTIRFRM